MGGSVVCDCGISWSYSLFKPTVASAAVSSLGSGSVVVDSLFIVALIVHVLCLVLVLFWGTECPFYFAIISLMKRELVALLFLECLLVFCVSSSRCLGLICNV